MRKIFYLLWLCIAVPAGELLAQDILPDITVKNYNGKIIVSWKNEYPLEVKTINIQRSFDSLKNFTTIGSVLNPQSTENGFVDEKPPYNKMYYRVFVSFDEGAYVFSESERPVKESAHPLPIVTIDDLKILPPEGKTVSKPGTYTDRTKQPNTKVPGRPATEIRPEVITYPSRRIFTAREGNIVINLANAETKKYIVKFFDESDKSLFELNKIKDDHLIIEKFNFLRAGWFYFEVYENGKLIEKNKFYIPKDGKN
ncbi:MAG TPA: hypothetical protein VK489_01115 [Ferruginibacter sp.]|nr:hypothetical protein [Ferruginibacter sp.]